MFKSLQDDTDRLKEYLREKKPLESMYPYSFIETSSNKTQIEIILLDPNVEIPTYATSGAAAMDISANIPYDVMLWPGESKILPTGFKLHIKNDGIAATIIPRSGKGSKGLVVGNLVGLIDSDYQGEVKICVWNRNAVGTPPIKIHSGEPIAQMIFVPIMKVAFKQVQEFNCETDRGEGGFGSTDGNF